MWVLGMDGAGESGGVKMETTVLEQQKIFFKEKIIKRKLIL